MRSKEPVALDMVTPNTKALDPVGINAMINGQTSPAVKNYNYIYREIDFRHRNFFIFNKETPTETSHDI